MVPRTSPFIQSIWTVIHEEALDFMQWNESGTSIIIRMRGLQHYLNSELSSFTMKKTSTFIEHLKQYQFKRLNESKAPERYNYMQFYHENFQYGQYERLRYVIKEYEPKKREPRREFGRTRKSKTNRRYHKVKKKTKSRGKPRKKTESTTDTDDDSVEMIEYQVQLESDYDSDNNSNDNKSEDNDSSQSKIRLRIPKKHALCSIIKPALEDDEGTTSERPTERIEEEAPKERWPILTEAKDVILTELGEVNMLSELFGDSRFPFILARSSILNALQNEDNCISSPSEIDDMDEHYSEDNLHLPYSPGGAHSTGVLTRAAANRLRSTLMNRSLALPKLVAGSSRPVNCSTITSIENEFESDASSEKLETKPEPDQGSDSDQEPLIIYKLGTKPIIESDSRSNSNYHIVHRGSHTYTELKSVKLRRKSDQQDFDEKCYNLPNDYIKPNLKIGADNLTIEQYEFPDWVEMQSYQRDVIQPIEKPSTVPIGPPPRMLGPPSSVDITEALEYLHSCNDYEKEMDKFLGMNDLSESSTFIANITLNNDIPIDFDVHEYINTFGYEWEKDECENDYSDDDADAMPDIDLMNSADMICSSMRVLYDQ